MCKISNGVDTFRPPSKIQLETIINFDIAMRQYLTISQAAKLLHVTPLTLRNWDKKGKLKPYRHPANNYRVYRLDQIEAFLRRIDGSRAKAATRKIDLF